MNLSTSFGVDINVSVRDEHESISLVQRNTPEKCIHFRRTQTLMGCPKSLCVALFKHLCRLLTLILQDVWG